VPASYRRSNEVYAHHLKALRRAAGWSQVQLGELTGLNPVMLSQLETKRRALPITMAVKLANALGVGIDLLVDRIPPEGPCSGFEVADLRPQVSGPTLASRRMARRPLTEAEAMALAAELEAQHG
jgi:transcriptional regulator with XRE-family HTH domain